MNITYCVDKEGNISNVRQGERTYGDALCDRMYTTTISLDKKTLYIRITETEPEIMRKLNDPRP